MTRNDKLIAFMEEWKGKYLTETETKMIAFRMNVLFGLSFEDAEEWLLRISLKHQQQRRKRKGGRNGR